MESATLVADGASRPRMSPDGILPVGIWDYTLEEIETQFGRFQRSDRRPMLFRHFKTLLEEIGGDERFLEVIVDGSFVTSEQEPNDIDLILVVQKGVLPLSELASPYEYNKFSAKVWKKRLNFDVFVVSEDSAANIHYRDFFGRIKGDSDRRKGMIRLRVQ